MVAKGYTTATLVAKELGRDLTAPQLDECQDLVEQAEAWIDRAAGDAWMVSSPTVNELHTVTGPVVYLRNRPVSAITSLSVRPFTVGSVSTALVQGTGYELLDPAAGLVSLLPSWDALAVGYGRAGYLGYLLTVSYTTATPAPGDIQRAATLLVAHWMLPRLEPDRQGVDSYSIGGELTVRPSKQDIPDEVLRLVGARERVLFA
jgi:hypothetical protein